MSFRKSIFFIICILFIKFSIADEVTINEARTVARNIYFEQMTYFDHNSSTHIIFSEVKSITKKGHLVCYVFNISNHEGFVIVSADDQAYPILGYSFAGNFIDEDQPPAFIAMFENYKDQIIFIKENQIPPDDRIISTWKHYLTSPAYFKAKKGMNVGPLLSTNWNQGCYFNADCPSDASGPCGHVWAGCVATAMAQIMKYYDYPVQGTGSHSYSAPGYGLQTANFGNTAYNWQSMPNNVNSQNAAVAELLYHCGVSVNMYYSPNGSGALSYNAVDALIDYFKYSTTATMAYKSYYSNSNWENMLRNELDEGRPVYYAGDDPNAGGHAFVCDGYQSTNFFHFNWGWSGAYNGYYFVSSLSPGSNNFTYNQEAIIGIRPVTGSCNGFQKCVAEYGLINDGSGNTDYENNADCYWLIQPPGSVSILLNFTSFDTENVNDMVKVYDGPDSLSALLGSFSGNSIPTQLNSTSGSMFIHFISNDTLTESGWEAEYYNTIPPKCSGTTVLNLPSGTFDDGSGSSDYGNLTDCKWLIQPPGANSITLTFNSFDLETGYDFVRVYKGTTTSDPILLIHSGSNIPPPKTSGSAILIHFTTDEFTTKTGWEASYTCTGNMGLYDNNLSESIVIYPNPNKGKFNLLMENELFGNFSLQIIDVLGRVLFQKEISKNEKIFNETIQCINLLKGYYILLIDKGLNQINKPFLVE
ncbi:C10 family peptidase [candidate division KSB1 bacterium]